MPFSGKVSVSTPVSKLTPPTPSSVPMSAFAEGRERRTVAPISVAQIGAVALRMDSRDAGAVLAAYANKEKGSAELRKPMMR